MNKRNFTRGGLLCSLAAFTFLAPARANAKATFVLNNVDAPGVGFNDPTPAAPVGGNNGTTVGQQRLNVFKYALDIWGKTIDSAVPIVVEASFPNFDCATGATLLGQARASGVEYSAAGFEIPGLELNVLYVEALADRLAGEDIDPGNPDIIAEFNGSVPECFPGTNWYYGFDGKAGADFDLASTVLHEVGHGLGFSYLPDPTTGDLFFKNMPDPFTRRLLDNATGKHFDVMTTAERLAATGDVRHVVWDGTYVKQAAASFLATGGPSLTLSPSVSGFFGALLEVNYGPHVPAQAITGPLVVGNPADGCDSLASLSGSIVLLTEGNCSQMNMSNNADLAGAKAVILAGEKNETPPKGSVEYEEQYLNFFTYRIPTVQLSKPEADLLRTAIASGVNATLVGNAAQRVGADAAGRPYIYASVPRSDASSMCHWDPLARPNLVLEPTATLDNSQDLTMEKALMRDIGWEPFCGNGKPDPTEECDNGAANSDTTPNACRVDCVKAKCGDKVVDTGEQCDDGPANSNATANACRTTCVKSKCGDGVVDTGEECDNASGADAGACAPDCKLPVTAATSGASNAAPDSDAGCSCRVPSPRARSSWLLAAATVLLLRFRRARPRRSGASTR